MSGVRSARVPEASAESLPAADAVRQAVLDVIQSGFPLEADPYGALAVQLGFTRQAVLDAVAALRADGSIRRLGASFNSKKLGYSSTLCAMAVPGESSSVDEVAAIVSSYPNVTHNYLRENRYNLWFTIIARGPGEVAAILDDMKRRTGCAEVLNLPATAVYKIRVDFGRSRRRASTQDRQAAASTVGPSGGSRTPAAPFNADDPFDVALVRWAQDDIAGPDATVDPEPFATAASRIVAELEDASIDGQRVIGRLRAWKADGTIRRFGALVAHRRIGYAFNGMTVWDVPPDSLDAVGRAFAAQPFVSHCYARPRSEAWPYNLYAMAHATSRDELDAQVGQLQALAGVKAQVLISTREYKKTSMRYF